MQCRSCGLYSIVDLESLVENNLSYDAAFHPVKVYWHKSLVGTIKTLLLLFLQKNAIVIVSIEIDIHFKYPVWINEAVKII